MRKTLPPALCNPPPEPAETSTNQRRRLLEIELPLRCITPVIGGGVKSFQPDEIDYLRIPAIRGQLRFWWRACQPLRNERFPKAIELFLHEARTWGGVGIQERENEAPKGWKSRVRMTVSNVQASDPIASGRHQRGPDGKLRAFANWNPALQACSYALFPLQMDRDTLNEHANTRDPVDTRLIREQLAFTLHIRLERSRKDGNPELSEEEKAECNQLLAALWAFVHFGGIGARTRRGFGALVPGNLQLRHASELDLRPWIAMFAPPNQNQVHAWLERYFALAGLRRNSTGGQGLPEWPVLHGIAWNVGTAQRSAGDAHGRLVEKLQQFRQGKNVGRDPGQQNRPGRSRWPEPDWLRRLVDKSRGAQRWAHPPMPLPPRDRREPVAPRAAFGLPIVVTFKDQNDKPANATLYPTAKGGRWASPLILRPLACADNQFVPLAFAFDRRPGRGPLKNMSVHLDSKTVNPKETMTASGYAGAASPIREYLGNRDIDAVEAFFDFLRKDPA